MATIQSAYSVNKALGYPGMVADAVDTVRASKAAAALVNFGTFVCRRASPADGVEQCANPAASADVTARPRGIALKDETRKNSTGGNVGGYAVDDQVVYLRKGRVVVSVEAAVTQDGAVFVRFAAGTFTQLGAFRGDADTASAVALPGATYLTSTVGAGLAIVEINIPA